MIQVTEQQRAFVERRREAARLRRQLDEWAWEGRLDADVEEQVLAEIRELEEG